MAGNIHRVTMFKLPVPEDQAKLVERYKTLGATHEKDGKPYILSMVVGPAEEDSRSQGFTFVAKTEFATMEDMQFYDTECPAHKELKAAAKDLKVEGMMTVYFKPAAVARIAGGGL